MPEVPSRPRKPRDSFRPGLEPLEDRFVPSIAPIFYSFNGSGNNLSHKTWGAAGTDLLRIAGTAYGDGISTPAGASRPNARELSNVLATQITDPEPNNHNLTDFIYAWGQFIDHDLDLTPSGSTEYLPITVPVDDSVFTPGSRIPFFRAVSDPASGTSLANARQAPNTVTSYLDGSMIYGSDATRAAALRTFVGGQLATSRGDLLPLNSASLPVEIHIPGTDPSSLYLAGDVRVNENAELAAITVLFVREHNAQASQLAREHPGWTDEQLFQGARQIVIAEIQHITYDEYLPALLGGNALSSYSGYNANVNPGIAAEFSAAAFRVGHSQVNQNIDFFDNDGNESHDPLDFNASADNPAVLTGQGDWQGAGVANILKYLAADNAQEVDSHFEDALRNQLFAPQQPAAGGLDLYAIDVQRGRDLGLPDYNTVRAAYRLPRVTSFNQITNDPTVQSELRSLYGTTTDSRGIVHDNVNNIDLFVAGLAETHTARGDVGSTFAAIIADQFQRLRTGDRLWYQRTFSGADLQRIQQTTLSDIIRRNTEISNLQDNVFFFTTGTISGKITAGSVQFPLVGTVVQLRDATGKVVATTVTNPDGSYRFDNVTEGATYQVHVIQVSPFVKSLPQPLTIHLADSEGAGAFHVDFSTTFRSPFDLLTAWGRYAARR